MITLSKINKQADLLRKLQRSLHAQEVIPDIFGKGSFVLKHSRIGGVFKRAWIEHEDGSTTIISKETFERLRNND